MKLRLKTFQLTLVGAAVQLSSTVIKTQVLKLKASANMHISDSSSVSASNGFLLVANANESFDCLAHDPVGDINLSELYVIGTGTLYVSYLAQTVDTIPNPN